MGLDPALWSAVRLTIWVASWAILLSLPVAIWVAYLLARKRFWGRQALNIAVHLPLVLPPVVTGYLLLVVFGRNGAAGQWLHDAFGLTFAFHWRGAALAAAVMAFPFMVRAIRLAIETVDRGLEDAAATLGAGRARIFLTITLPLIWPGILAGAVLGFAKALGEFGATITFVAAIPGQTETISAAIYGLLQVPNAEAQVLALVVISVVLAACALIGSELLSRRAHGGQARDD